MSVLGRSSLWMCAAYFTFYAGIACWGPYIALYYKHLGLSGVQIGLLSATAPLGMALLAPVWGSLADSRGAHRLILRIALLTTGVVALLIAGASSFWQVLPLIIVLALVGTTASPLLDSYGVIISAQHGIGFGQLRVWGSIGYTVIVWVIGYAMGGEVSRLFLFCYAATLVLTCLMTIGLPARREQRSQNRWRGAPMMLRRPDIRMLLLTVFFLSISTNPVFALFGLYIADLGGSTSMLGATSALAAVSEFPVLFFGSRLIRRWGSQRIFLAALCIYILRIFLYSIIPSVEWVLPVQLLHGFSFGLYLMASVTLIHDLVGPDLTATAQGLLASAMACGQIVGSLVAGFALDRIGIVAIYRFSAGITLLALVVFVIGLRWYGRAGAGH
jgi:PPP family 3-phenylpropionic acid transporter